MTIHVVLLNWNQGDAVRTMLQRIQSWTGLSLRIWVVDNASTDQSGSTLSAAFPDARILFNPENRGYAGGINTALREIQPVAEADDLILLINNDVQIEPACVISLVDGLRQNPDAGMIGPVLLEGRPEQPRRSWGGRDIGRYVHTRISTPPGSPDNNEFISVDYVPGTVLLFRTALLDRIGLLDEDYFFSGEIADYAARVRKAGLLCLVCRQAEANHLAHDEQQLRGTLYLYYSLRNRFLYIRKHQLSGYKCRFMKWTCIGLAMAAKNLLTGRFAASRAVGFALTDGWSGRFGNRNERFIA